MKTSSKKMKADTVKNRHQVHACREMRCSSCSVPPSRLPLTVQFDWVQELKRLNAEESALDRDLMQFSAQIADGLEGERLMTTAEVKLSHNQQLSMFKAQLGAIKLLMLA